MNWTNRVFGSKTSWGDVDVQWRSEESAGGTCYRGRTKFTWKFRSQVSHRMCLRAIKTKHYSQRVPIVGTVSCNTASYWDLCFKQLCSFKTWDERVENMTTAPEGQRSCYAPVEVTELQRFAFVGDCAVISGWHWASHCTQLILYRTRWWVCDAESWTQKSSVDLKWDRLILYYSNLISTRFILLQSAPKHFPVSLLG